MVPVCVPQPILPVAKANGTSTPLQDLKRLHNAWIEEKAMPGEESEGFILFIVQRTSQIGPATEPLRR